MVKTRQGWIGGVEVVEVWYDPKTLPFANLLSVAEEKDCTRGIWSRSEEQQALAEARVGERALLFSGEIRLDAEQKYYLLKSPLKDLPLSEAQACRVNANLKGDWQRYLSPWQIAHAKELMDAAKQASAKAESGR